MLRSIPSAELMWERSEQMKQNGVHVRNALGCKQQETQPTVKKTAEAWGSTDAGTERTALCPGARLPLHSSSFPPGRSLTCALLVAR